LDRRFGESQFDVVSMIELIEHVADPRDLLETAVELLRPGGVVYLTTPNAASLNCRLLGPTWSVLCPPDHLTLWTSGGLRSALKRAGLQASRIDAEGLNPAEILARFRRSGRAAPAFDRNRAAQALNARLMSRSYLRLLKRSANHVLRLLVLGDTLKAVGIKDGS
jgi:SAM-dependent methyltransferase